MLQSEILAGTPAKRRIFAQQSVPLRTARNREEKFLGRERLGKIVHRPGLDGFHREFWSGIGSDHQRGQVGPLPVDFGEQFIAIHATQTGIGDNHEKRILRQTGQGLLGRFGGADRVTLFREHHLERTTHVFFVVHDQHRGQRFGHWINGLGCDFMGKITVNFAPFPSSDSTRTAPPYNSALCLTMARPKPVPFSLVVK